MKGHITKMDKTKYNELIEGGYEIYKEDYDLLIFKAANDIFNNLTLDLVSKDVEKEVNETAVTLEEQCSTTLIEKEHPMKTCTKCDKKANNFPEMRRHERDTHGVITPSTSPTLKRKRIQLDRYSALPIN